MRLLIKSITIAAASIVCLASAPAALAACGDDANFVVDKDFGSTDILWLFPQVDDQTLRRYKTDNLEDIGNYCAVASAEVPEAGQISFNLTFNGENILKPYSQGVQSTTTDGTESTITVYLAGFEPGKHRIVIDRGGAGADGLLKAMTVSIRDDSGKKWGSELKNRRWIRAAEEADPPLLIVRTDKLKREGKLCFESNDPSVTDTMSFELKKPKPVSFSNGGCKDISWEEADEGQGIKIAVTGSDNSYDTLNFKGLGRADSSSGGSTSIRLEECIRLQFNRKDANASEDTPNRDALKLVWSCDSGGGPTAASVSGGQTEANSAGEEAAQSASRELRKDTERSGDAGSSDADPLPAPPPPPVETRKISLIVDVYDWSGTNNASGGLSSAEREAIEIEIKADDVALTDQGDGIYTAPKAAILTATARENSSAFSLVSLKFQSRDDPKPRPPSRPENLSTDESKVNSGPFAFDQPDHLELVATAQLSRPSRKVEISVKIEPPLDQFGRERSPSIWIGKTEARPSPTEADLFIVESALDQEELSASLDGYEATVEIEKRARAAAEPTKFDLANLNQDAVAKASLEFNARPIEPSLSFTVRPTLQIGGWAKSLNGCDLQLGVSRLAITSPRKVEGADGAYVFAAQNAPTNTVLLDRVTLNLVQGLKPNSLCDRAAEPIDLGTLRDLDGKQHPIALKPTRPVYLGVVNIQNKASTANINLWSDALKAVAQTYRDRPRAWSDGAVFAVGAGDEAVDWSRPLISVPWSFPRSLLDEETNELDHAADAAARLGRRNVEFEAVVDAAAKASDGPFDLVLLDDALGYDVCERIQAFDASTVKHLNSLTVIRSNPPAAGETTTPIGDLAQTCAHPSNAAIRGYFFDGARYQRDPDGWAKPLAPIINHLARSNQQKD